MTTPVRHRRSTTTRPAGGLAALAVLVVALLTGGCSDGGGDAGPEFSPVAAPTTPSRTAGSGDDDLWSDATGTTASTTGATAVTCEESAREPVPAGADWRHPQRSFYTGSERRLPSATDLEHLMSTDAAAVVRYRAELLPAASLDALRSWAETTEAVVAVPADGATSRAVVVDLVHERLECDGLDTLRLDAFVAEREEGTGHDHE